MVFFRSWPLTILFTSCQEEGMKMSNSPDEDMANWGRGINKINICSRSTRHIQTSTERTLDSILFSSSWADPPSPPAFWTKPFISTAVDGPTRLRGNASLKLHKPVVSLSVTKKSVRSGFRSHVWRREIHNVFVLQVNVYLPPIWRLFLKHLSPRIKNLICSKQKYHIFKQRAVACLSVISSRL